MTKDWHNGGNVGFRSLSVGDPVRAGRRQHWDHPEKQHAILGGDLPLKQVENMPNGGLRIAALVATPISPITLSSNSAIRFSPARSWQQVRLESGVQPVERRTSEPSAARYRTYVRSRSSWRRLAG
jgi:hypothetical protein